MSISAATLNASMKAGGKRRQSRVESDSSGSDGSKGQRVQMETPALAAYSTSAVAHFVFFKDFAISCDPRTKT